MGGGGGGGKYFSPDWSKSSTRPDQTRKRERKGSELAGERRLEKRREI